MESLLGALQRAARARGLTDYEDAPDFPRVAAWIRDMPYRRTSDHDPATIVREWRGTCSGKHYLLDHVAGELRIPSQLYHCRHRLTAAHTTPFPAELRDLIPLGGLSDVHTVLRAQLRGRWVVLDVTWPARLAALGFPANVRWNGISDMVVAADVEEEFVARGDPQAMKERLIASRYGAQRELGDRFILGLTGWLATATADCPG